MPSNQTTNSANAGTSDPTLGRYERLFNVWGAPAVYDPEGGRVYWSEYNQVYYFETEVGCERGHDVLKILGSRVNFADLEELYCISDDDAETAREVIEHLDAFDTLPWVTFDAVAIGLTLMDPCTGGPVGIDFGGGLDPLDPFKGSADEVSTEDANPYPQLPNAAELLAAYGLTPGRLFDIAIHLEGPTLRLTDAVTWTAVRAERAAADEAIRQLVALLFDRLDVQTGVEEVLLMRAGRYNDDASSLYTGELRAWFHAEVRRRLDEAATDAGVLAG